MPAADFRPIAKPRRVCPNCGTVDGIDVRGGRATYYADPDSAKGECIDHHLSAEIEDVPAPVEGSLEGDLDGLDRMLETGKLTLDEYRAMWAEAHAMWRDVEAA